MDKMASKIKDALPAHLKSNGAEGERHHGKSQSHVVSLKHFGLLLHRWKAAARQSSSSTWSG